MERPDPSSYAEDGRCTLVNLSAATVWAHAKKHPASLQGTLGFLGFSSFPMENVSFLGPKSVEHLGGQGWDSCGGFLAAEPPLYT